MTKFCFVCGKTPVHPGRKYSICAYCIVNILLRTKIIEVQLPAQKTEGKKICWFCNNDVILKERKHCMCFDCIVQALINKHLLKIAETDVLVVKKVFLSVTDELVDIVPENTCNICKRDIINKDRQHKVCLDCVIDVLIAKDVISIEKKPVISHS